MQRKTDIAYHSSVYYASFSSATVKQHLYCDAIHNLYADIYGFAPLPILGTEQEIKRRSFAALRTCSLLTIVKF